MQEPVDILYVLRRLHHRAVPMLRLIAPAFSAGAAGFHNVWGSDDPCPSLSDFSASSTPGTPLEQSAGLGQIPGSIARGYFQNVRQLTGMGTFPDWSAPHLRQVRRQRSQHNEETGTAFTA